MTTAAKSEIPNLKSPDQARPCGAGALARELVQSARIFPLEPTNTAHHLNLVGITSPNRTVFVPLFTLLILACLDDPRQQNLKSRISNLK